MSTSSYGSYRGNNGGYKSSGSQQRPGSLPEKSYVALNKNDYVDRAEKDMTYLLKEWNCALTTSKIRSILAMTAEILNKVNSAKAQASATDAINERIKGDLTQLRIRCVYECGRFPEVKDFMTQTQILKHIANVKTLEQCESFCHYMEALVAYHRYLGGKD